MGFGFFVAGALSLLAITSASAAGEEAVRILMISALISVFVIGGGLLGLLVSYHAAQTHLPDEARSDLSKHGLQSEEEEAPLTQERARGFLGMFSLSQDAGELDDAGKPRGEFRRTA
jgi:hypothetical protein